MYHKMVSKTNLMTLIILMWPSYMLLCTLIVKFKKFDHMDDGSHDNVYVETEGVFY